MRWPLSRQILLPMVGILLLTIGVVSALNAWLASDRVKRQIEEQLRDVARTLETSNFPLEVGVLRQMRGLTGAEYAVDDARGRSVAASDPDFASAGPYVVLQNWRGLRLQAPVRVAGEDYYYTRVFVERRAASDGPFEIGIFYPRSAWRDAYWHAIWPPLAIGGVAVVLVALAAWIIASRLTQPIARLRRQVKSIALGNFSPFAVPTRNDEVRDLALAVNQLAERLARYEQEIRQSERLKTLGTLGGGIAHQVRNAATGCRIALDLHQRDCPAAAQNGHADEEPLAVAVRQLGLIETHIQRLLALGRPSAAEKRPVALADVAEQALSLVRPMAQHVGVKLAVEFSPQPLVVAADSAALVQMLVNLLVNAVQATSQAHAFVGAAAGDDPVVIVRTEPVPGGRGRLAVGDPGPGPAAEIEGRLFEPFATDKPGGTGLGLVVSRQIAEDHGGTIGWRREGERTCFFVELPLAQET